MFFSHKFCLVILDGTPAILSKWSGSILFVTSTILLLLVSKLWPISCINPHPVFTSNTAPCSALLKPVIPFPAFIKPPLSNHLTIVIYLKLKSELTSLEPSNPQNFIVSLITSSLLFAVSLGNLLFFLNQSRAYVAFTLTNVLSLNTSNTSGRLGSSFNSSTYFSRSFITSSSVLTPFI